VRTGRLPAATGDLRTDAIAELRWAMGGAGLTVGKVPHLTAVSRLPRVAETVNGVSAAARPAEVHRVLVEAARDLGNGVQARLLRSSLAVDYAGAGRNLTARRAEFVAAHNTAARATGSRTFVGDSPRAAYDVEAEMLGALVTALGAPSGGVPPPAPGEERRPTRTVEFEVTYRLRGRAGYEAEVAQTLVALEDGVDGIEVQYYCGTADGGPAKLALYEGGDLAEDREFGRPGYRTARIRYPVPLRAGDRHRIRYDTLYPGTSETPDTWFTLAVATELERATVRVTFDRAEPPCRVWRVEGAEPETGGGDPDAAEPLVPDPTGHVAATFVAPPIGLRYGVAWAWPA
jgi:hypothetical protein